ncbi:MAG: hypothetical protein M1308_09170 [Actinobacteria bacterium]|nr:hypothetical protein [Actinomycetota bacterium]
MEYNDLKTEYKFQVSIKNGEDILVVRADEINQLVLDLEEAKSQIFNEHKLSRTAENLVNRVKAAAPVNPARICPECGSPLVKGTTKTGKSFEKCSTNTWDKDLKQAVGCPYVNWNA